MGLIYPEDLEAWSRWQANTHLLRRGKNALKDAAARVRGHKVASVAPASVTGFLHLPAGSDLQTLIALDSTSPTSLGSLIRPAKWLAYGSYAVWAPEEVTEHLPDGEWEVTSLAETDLDFSLGNLRHVLALGHYMAWGAAAYRLAQRTGARFVTVQHGLHTPYAPPLAPGTHLLAFSQADAEFWISGRKDVTYHVVGSQLFWEAAQKPKVDPAQVSETPIFLGQMHGAELPRASFAYASLRFVRQHRAIYRPHPSEKDKLSRLTHSLMGRLGTTIDSSRRPLNQVDSPVVSIFSTGVLEAALRGVPAWVYHPHPPAWLKEFWDRYGMNQWGSEPTPAPQLPDREPAQQIAEYLTQSLES